LDFHSHESARVPSGIFSSKRRALSRSNRRHATAVMRKLDLHSVSELVRYALRNQIVQA